MRVAGIIKNSVANGIGVRDVIFLQGCKHKCEGCHNPHTWDMEGGEEYSIEEVLAELSESKNNITISGGEPLLQFDALFHLAMKFNSLQNKSVWVYTGCKYEDIPFFMKWTLSHHVDVLVDGPFEQDKKDLTLQFRGSSNQRLIDLPKSVEQLKVIEWSDVNE